MKHIIVLYNKDDWNETFPMLNTATKRAFEEWHTKGELLGVHFYRAHIKWYNRATGAFDKAWMFRDGRWIKTGAPVMADLILDKVAGKHNYHYFALKMKIAKRIKMVNHPLFRTPMDNKFTQYLFLQEFMVPSFLVTTPQELTLALDTLVGEKAVLKPLHGSGGHGVLIENKEVLRNMPLTFPLLAQTFVVTSGIPPLSQPDEVVDLRLVYIDHTFAYAISRIAVPGSLFTNFHQGATAEIIAPVAIPSNVTLFAERIVQKLSAFPGASYSLDFMFDESGSPFLVEMNTTPGMDLLHTFGDEALKESYFQAFLKNLP